MCPSSEPSLEAGPQVQPLHPMFVLPCIRKDSGDNHGQSSHYPNKRVGIDKRRIKRLKNADCFRGHSPQAAVEKPAPLPSVVVQDLAEQRSKIFAYWGRKISYNKREYCHRNQERDEERIHWSALSLWDWRRCSSGVHFRLAICKRRVGDGHIRWPSLSRDDAAVGKDTCDAKFLSPLANYVKSNFRGVGRRRRRYGGYCTSVWKFQYSRLWELALVMQITDVCYIG